MKPIMCIAEPAYTKYARAARKNFPKETIIINGIQFTGLDGDVAEEFAKIYPMKNAPERMGTYYARIDRSLFPKDTTLILPSWM